MGIVPLEAMAAGCPVIALARGGALETVLQNQTGIFFNEPTAEALTTAVQEFERKTFDRSAISAGLLNLAGSVSGANSSPVLK